MLDFKKYSSIENTYDKDFVGKVKEQVSANQIFAVQEKVHGSNCSFLTDGVKIEFAKRTSLVEHGEKFYDYEELLARYNERVLNLYQHVKAKYADLQTLIVFGEMFGGNYPHPEVKNNHRIMTIQKGVAYSPVHEFYGFDLYIASGETGYFLPVGETNVFFENGGFIHAKTIFEGTLDECLKYPNDFPSTVYKDFNLPPIDGNICEGVVIRPVETLYLRNGARVLLKNKNAHFAEKKSIRKHAPKVFVELTYSETLQKLLPEVGLYITENRLNNVVSKIGEISVPRDTGKLIGLMSKDTLDDFLKEHSGDYAALEKSEQKILNTHVNKNVTALIKKIYFENFGN